MTPAAASKLAFTTLAQAVIANNCSALTGLQSQDTFGNAATVGASTQINDTSSSPTLLFFSDAACATPVTFTTIAAGGSTTGFYFKDPTAGAPSLTASSGSLAGASQVETINPQPASKLAFTTAAQSVVAGAC